MKGLCKLFVNDYCITANVIDTSLVMREKKKKKKVTKCEIIKVRVQDSLKRRSTKQQKLYYLLAQFEGKLI